MSISTHQIGVPTQSHMGSGSGSVKDSGAERFPFYDFFLPTRYASDMAEADPQLQQHKAARTQTAKKQGCCFRSDLLDEFAKVEDWINSTLVALRTKKQTTACITQRLDELHDDAMKQPSPFKNPGRIKKLINDCRELVKIRNSIVHSIMEVDVTHSTHTFWIFNNVAMDKPAYGKLDFRFDEAAFSGLILAVRKLSSELSQQLLKDANDTAKAKPAATKPKAQP